MKPQGFLILVWFCSGAGAVGGSILGNALGAAGLFVGALLGGLMIAVLSARLGARIGLIEVEAARFASVGAAIGFLAAAPIAATNLHTPVIPVLACALSGVGALVGVGRARARTS